MSENNLFVIFPDLPWPTHHIQQPAHRVWGAAPELSAIARRSLARERPMSRRLISRRNAHDALQRIRIIAVNQRRRLSGKSGCRRALDEIIAITDAAEGNLRAHS